MWEHAAAMETETDDVDEALARARSGDETGFLLLWEALHPRLLRYLQVLGCDDVADVPDAACERSRNSPGGAGSASRNSALSLIL